MSNINVTLIGGPADLQRHAIDRRLRHYQVASVPDSSYFGPPRAGGFEDRALCEVHVYEVREIDRGVFVGIHRPARPERREEFRG